MPLSFREVSPVPCPLASHPSSTGMVVCNWVVILSVCITVLCVFDPTGRTFVKLRATKRRQRNLRTYNLRSVGWARGWDLLTPGRQRPAPHLPHCISTCVSPRCWPKAYLNFLVCKVGTQSFLPHAAAVRFIRVMNTDAHGSFVLRSSSGLKT